MPRNRGRRESIAPDPNRLKREQYAGDASIRENTKEAARQRYRSANPKPVSRLEAGQLLTPAIQREVSVTGMRKVRILDTYTIPEAAAALGKSVANFRRWITNDLIPSPYLKDRERSHYCYCAEELRIMARILAVHEREFVYFCAKHETTSNQLHQAITGYRAITFGADAVDSYDLN